MKFRSRLSLTQLEERETPSDIAPPMDPVGGSGNNPPPPAQGAPPAPGDVTYPMDPTGH